MPIPGFLLRETASVEPWTGPGVFGPASTRRVHVQEDRALVTNDDGTVSEATLALFLGPGISIPVGSRVTTRGDAYTAVQVQDNHTRGLAPVLDHIEVRLELAAFLPTTTMTLTRGTSGVDEYGDPIDSTTAVAEGLDAHVIEQRETRFDPASQRTGVVEEYTIRLRATVDVREGDHLTDATTGRSYIVTGVAQNHTVTGPERGTDDVRVLARRVAPTSTRNT